LSLEDEVAVSVQAELAEEASNRPATYNNCSVKHNARALHRYFLAKTNWANLTNKQRYTNHKKRTILVQLFHMYLHGLFVIHVESFVFNETAIIRSNIAQH
jgi:hypothetical protein